MTLVDQEDRAEVEADSHPARLGGTRLLLHDTVGPVPIRAGWDAEPLVVDWFGEGGADLLVVAGGVPARVYRRQLRADDGTVVYAEAGAVPGLEALRSVAAIPNGSETRFDLVALSPTGLVYLPNEGIPGEPRFESRIPLGFPADLGLGPGRVAQIVADDWDGDDRVDLVIGFDDMTGYWPDDAAGVPREQQCGWNQGGGHPGYDQHGRWRGAPPRGRLFWMRNRGEPGAPRFEPPEEIVSASGRVAVGLRPAPLTVAWGGQALELLLTDDTGTVRLHRNFGGQRPPVLLDPRPLKQAGRPLVLPDDRTTVLAADLDQDRKPELVLGANDGRIFAIHCGRGRDEAEDPRALLTDDPVLRVGGHAVVAAADLDADGDVDLIVGDGPGRLWLVEALEDHRYAAPVELDASGLPFRLDPGPDGLRDGPAARKLGFACPAIADWDANGRLDLVVGGAGGEVLYFHHNGSRAQPRWERPIALCCDGQPLVTPPRVRPGIACWTDGDLPDLITLDLQGFLCVYPRTGPYEVGPPRPLVDRLGRVPRLDGGFGQAGRCALWVGPWTAPDRLDILVGLPCGARHVVPALTGRPLSAVEDLPTVLLLEAIGPDTLLPRPVYHADGRPLIVGRDGCSPCGVCWSGTDRLDLLVGSDDGQVHVFRREELRW